MLQRTAQGKMQLWGPENIHPSLLLSLLHGWAVLRHPLQSLQLADNSQVYHVEQSHELSGAWLAKILPQSGRGVPGVLTEIRPWVAGRVASTWEVHQCLPWSLFLLHFFFPAIWMMEFTGCHWVTPKIIAPEPKTELIPLRFLIASTFCTWHHSLYSSMCGGKKILVASLFRSAALSSACFAFL